jgi:uncharacterized protein YbaA (DUF1428 family)
MLLKQPLPKKNIAEYKRQATAFGKMAIKYGAIDYREFSGEDLHPKGAAPFTKMIKLKAGEVLVGATVAFASRKQRDAVMKKMFADPKLATIMEEKPLFDTKRMHYGGFESIVSF